MSAMGPFSLAIPAFNSSPYLRDALALPLRDDRIAEIAIVDDGSPPAEFARLERIVTECRLAAEKPVVLERVDGNRGALANKCAAVAACSREWVILLDADNLLTPAYLDAMGAGARQEGRLLLPAWARTFDRSFDDPPFPLLDFREFGGTEFTLRSFRGKRLKADSKLDALLNNGNFAVHRRSYAEVAARVLDHSVLRDCASYDVAAFICGWLVSGRTLYVVPDCTYMHRLHPDSHWMITHRLGEKAHTYVRRRLTTRWPRATL